MSDWEPIDLNHPALNKPRCACDHGPDDVCVNGYVYTYCESEFCGGACSPEWNCTYVPGCCNYERDERARNG
jgi:hypothetical protein